MSAKSGFKRFISVILSFAIAFSTFADLLPSSIVFAADDDSGMHIIIQHWHTEEAGGLKSSDVTLTSDVYVDNGEIPPVVSAAKGELTFNALPDTALETFAGFAVSAGNDCVKLNPTVATLTVKYDSNVHLVKVNVFYSAKPKLVPGTEMTVGTEDVTGKYKDTEWAEIDTELQEKIVAAIGEDRFDELLTGDIGDQYIKLYNTSEGLHTDKTATAVYNDDKNNKGTTSEDKTGDGTRVFDINLEAWYNDQATAKVGLILDASGSMAFISDGLEPMKLEYDEKAYAYKYKDKVTGEVKKISGVSKNQYLTPEQVNQILDTNLTDNSKLSYSDYSYYIYDTRDFTQEFVPLAYWGGNNTGNITMSAADRTLKSLNGIGDLGTYVNFDGGYKNNVDDSLVQWVNFVDGGFITSSNSSHSGKSSGNDYNQPSGAGGGLELVKSLFKGKKETTAEEREFISLPIKANSEGDFTLSFAVKQKPNKEKTNWTGSLFYIGGTDSKEIKNGYTIEMKNDNSDDYKHIYIKQNGDSKVTLQRVLKQDTDSNGFWHFTIVFDKQSDGKYHLTVYQNNKILPGSNPGSNGAYVESTKATLDALDGDISIILGGLDTTEKYDSNNPQVFLDEICIYGEALGESKVHDIYTAINITEESAAESTKAIDEFDNIIATYDDGLNGDGVTATDRAGWYFVNSGSDLTNFYDKEIGTAKELCGLLPNEVIKNEIDISKLPISDKALNDLRKACGYETETSVEEFRKESCPVGSGYIATSEDFMGKGYLWKDAGKGEEVTVEATDGAEYKVAITMPEGKTRQYISGNSPCVFFIDDWGYLRCFYNNGSTSYDTKKEKYSDELRSGVSYVYQKDDETNIKTEDLQYALGQFAAQLHNATPNSMISAVRFSNQKIGEEYANGEPAIDGGDGKYDKDLLKKLVLLDWTSDTKEISQILSLKRGDGGTLDKVDSNPKDKGLANETQIEQYNYGMTGGTYTWTGFQAYTDLLDSRIKYGEDADPAKKYIILFTDGMDNTLEKDGDEARGYAIKLAKTLKEDKDYTIFCVVLKNKSFETSGRAEKVQKYMAEIAGNTNTVDMTYEELSSGDPQNKYIFEADDVEGLTDAFTEQILDKISSNLIDYTVRDYIDPRFDLVDNEGNTIVLGKDGNVTGGTLNSSLPKDYPNDDENVKVVGTITNIDGEEAVLCYNKTEDRYYLDWFKQDIPGTTPKQNSLTIWSRTFRIKAKEDFIGGNAILSNGNKEKENWVFNDKDNDGDTSNDKDDASSGVDDAKLDKEDVDDVTNELKDPYVSKGFPRTAVNVRLLTPKEFKGSDTIYMGEKIVSEEVAKDIIQIVNKVVVDKTENKNDCYWDYLKRYYARDPLGELKDAGKTVVLDYEAAFNNAINDLLKTAKTITVADYSGLGAYLGDTETTTAYMMSVPYVYLPNDVDGLYTNTVGTGQYLKDRVGEITYMIVQYEPKEEDGVSIDELSETEIVTENTKTRKYLLWVQFKADQIEDDGNEETDDKPRAKAVKDLVNDTDYSWDSTYKPVAGKEQIEQHKEGPYEKDIVKGEIEMEWEIGEKDGLDILPYLAAHFPDKQIEYTAELVRDYNTISDVVGTFSVTIDPANPQDDHTVTFTPSAKDAAGNESKTDYATMFESYGLPIGKYSVKNETTKFGDTVDVFKFTTALAQDIKEDDLSKFRSSSMPTPTALTPDELNVSKAAPYDEETSIIYLGYGKDEEYYKTNIYTDDLLGLLLIRGDISTGSLSITKEVTYDEDSYGEYDENTEFTFEVTLDAYGQFKTEKGKEGTIGEPDKAFGTRPFTLKKGETLTIKDIPVGTAFTVTEVPVPEGYTADPAKENGTIAKDGKTVTVTNTYSASGELELKIAKEIVGRKWLDIDSFTFEIERTDTGDKDAVTMPEATTVTINNYTEGHAASFNTITFNRIGTYTFTVKETSGDKLGLEQDPKTYTVKVTVSPSESGDSKLKVEYVTVIDGENSDPNPTITFTNTAKPVDWSFNITKNLTGRTWKGNEEFTFIVTSDNENAKVVSSPVTVGETEPATVNVTFSAEGTYTFTVQEQGGNSNGLTYDTTEHTIKVTVNANEKTGELEVTEVTVDKESPTTNADKIKSINLGITNEYKASGTAEFKIQKTLQDKEEKTIDWGGRKFTFTLTADAKNPEGATIPDNIELSSSAEQTFTINFSNITFDDGNSKDYKFTLKEDAPADTQGITYDTKEYDIVVTVEDNGDGTIASTVKVNDAEDGTATFTNTYEAKSVTWAPQVKKTLAGREWETDESFTFTVTSVSSNPADGVKMPTDKTATASGEVGTSNPATASFNAITFTKAGEYTFTIREDGTDGNGLTYDKRVYNVNVTVSDDGSGKLYIEAVTADGESVESFNFENIYTPAAATIDVSGTKSFTLANGEAPADNATFTFTFNVIETDSTWTEEKSTEPKTVEFSGSDLSSTPSQKPIVDLLKKTYELKDISEIKDGGYVNYYYKVTEKNDGTAHISYDNAEYHITVTVNYSVASGILSVSADVTDANGDKADIEFSNTYIPDAIPATANITVTKEVKGDELNEDFTFTFTVTETDENHEPLTGAAQIPPITITNEGSTLFTREFTASDIGTHYYTIAENDLNNPRFECDKHVKYVTVTVGYDPATNTVTAEPSVPGVKFTNTYTAPKPHIMIAKSQTVVNGISGTPLTVKAGDIVEYTLTVSNDGDVDATAVKVVDTVPTGLIIDDIGSGTLDGQNITWTLAVGAHSQAAVSFKVTVPPVTTRTTWQNIAYADGTPSEQVVLIEEKPRVGSIEIRKTLTGNDFDTNDRFSFTIEVYGEDGVTPILADTFELGQGGSKKYDNLPDGAKFTVREVENSLGYTPSVNGVSGNYYEGVVKNGTTIVVRFENERSKPVVQTGSLIVRKTVAGPAEAIIPETFGFTYSLGLPSDFTKTEFDYTISHFDYMGVEVIDGRGTLGVSGTFSLNNGQRIRISGLPAGTTYQVDELPTVGSYIVDRYNTSGVITLDENGAVADAYAVFVNTIKTGQLTVSKTAVGNLAMSTDMFGFAVSLYHDAALSEPAQEVGGQFGGMYFDAGVAYISLADGESVTAVGLPVGLYYKVEEIEASGYESGVAGEQIGVITTGMISDTETCSAAFINLKQKNVKTGDLTVSKIVTGEGDTSYPFPFTLELYYHDTAGSPEVLAADVNLTGKIIGGEPRDVSVTGGCAAFNLSHGESLRLEGLPEDIHYIITETDPNGHTVTISNTGAFTPTYYDPFYGIMTVDETPSNVASGDVKGGEHVSVTFYNHIEPEPEPEPASTSLTIKKTFDQNGSTKDNALTFSFDVALVSAVDPSGSPITDASGNYLTNVTVNKGEEEGYGTVELSFDRAGTYTFSIKERAEYIGDVPEGGELYTVTEEKLATVTVTEVDGILTATPIEPIVFENRYVAPKEPPTPSSAVITVQKRIECDDISGESFAFDFTVTETDQSGEIIDELHITNEGTDTFITREFTEEDIGNTYYYTITEVDGGIKGMSYADAQTVTVSVTYDEAANAVVATATPNPVVFTNTYTRPDPDLAEIRLTKKVSDSSGKEYAEGSFTFEVNLTSHPEYSENGFTNGKATVTVDGGATVVLTVPFGAEYEITEINVPDGYTDSTEKLKGVADGSTVELIYNNVKTPKTGSLTLRKILVVDGRISEGGRKFRFKIELLGSDFTGDANGVSFDTGVAWVELSGGESVTMTGLPVGVDYVITEDSASGYTLLSESSSGLSGTITADSEAVAIAVNATFGSRTPITPPPMTPEPDPDDRVEIIPSTEGSSGEGDEVPDESEPNPITGALGSGIALLLAAALAWATKRR